MKVFSERTDVVLKTILRAFRKFYAKSFNDLTDYKKLKRRVTFKNNQQLISLISEYVSKRFGVEHVNNLEYYVAALVLPRVFKSITVQNVS